MARKIKSIHVTDTTLEPDEDRLDVSMPAASGGAARWPRMTVLYMSDVERIGLMTTPELFQAGEWVTFGRSAPFLVGPTPAIADGPLGDPYISRKQFKIRWIEGWGRFEVLPEAKGRRPLMAVDLAKNEDEAKISPITELTRLSPGSLIAIGNRVLIQLELAPWNGPEIDRHGMVGESVPMWELRDTISQVTRLNDPVLVLGQTGAGKELVSYALHKASAKGDGPFVPVNCAALPENLAESLLFGHKKGSFTGAHQDQMGLFREADGGSLFLDELGELPMGIQAKLLRVIQEGCVTPVGTHKMVPVDVRLIAATNRDPRSEIKKGNLREDFYYRIAAHVLRLPPLKERRFDVPMIFTHFLGQAREDYADLEWLFREPNAKTPTIPMAFFLELMRWRWPGNVRELRNVVKQTVRHNLHGGPFVAPTIASEDDETPSDLDEPLEVEAPSVDEDTLPSGEPMSRELEARVSRQLGMARRTMGLLLPETGVRPQDPGESFDAFVLRVQEKLTEGLLEQLVEHDFYQNKVAEQLGISRTTLIKLMGSLGIPRPQDLDKETILNAYRAAGGDLDETALALKVTPMGLKIYMTRMGLVS